MGNGVCLWFEMTRAERAREVKRIREQLGRKPLQREVSAQLGISMSYAASLITDPEGIKDRERKASYDGICEGCGGRTSGSEGPSQVKPLCASCVSDARKVWTAETVVDAIRRFAIENGRPPTATEWQHADRGRGYPATSTVYSNHGRRRDVAFGSWADAIQAAGFPRPNTGRRTTNEPRGEPSMANFTRDYIIFEIGRNGSDSEQFTVRAVVDAKNNAEALEKAGIEMEGEYASVPIASLQRFRLRPKMVAERQ